MKRAFYILIVLLAFVGLNSSTVKTTQMPDTRAVVKALYIYTFATLVEWPEQKRSGDFVIGVFGEKTSVYEELVKKYSGKAIGSQKIVIQNYRNKEAIQNCHILYITEVNSHYVQSLSTQMAPKNTLLVSEKAGSLSKGAIVNFVLQGNQQKYEINKTNAKTHKLVIADKLTDLAVNVIK